MNPNIDNHISCPASLNSQVKSQSRSYHYFLGFGLAAESLLKGIAANTVQLKTTLISLLGYINLTVVYR